jgi:hypothetical protein
VPTGKERVAHGAACWVPFSYRGAPSSCRLTVVRGSEPGS